MEHREPGFAAVVMASASYPVLQNCGLVLALLPPEHGFCLLTNHKGSKKACLLVHVNYITVTDRDKNPVLPFQLEHPALVDGVKSILSLFGPAACSCTFHEQNGIWVIGQFVNVLDELLGIPYSFQQTRVLVLIFTEAKVSL